MPCGLRSARGLAACAAYRRWGIPPRPEDPFIIGEAAKPCSGENVAMETGSSASLRRASGKRHLLVRHAQVAHWRASRLDPTVRGLLWTVLAGLLFVFLNSLLRGLSLQLDPFQAQFLRYL